MEQTTNLTHTFLYIKPVDILVAIRDSKTPAYASQIFKKINCTYSHLVKTLHHFEEQQLLTMEKHSRMKLVTLTKKGVELADKLIIMKKYLEPFEKTQD